MNALNRNCMVRLSSGAGGRNGADTDYAQRRDRQAQGDSGSSGQETELARGRGAVVVKCETDWVFVCARAREREQRNYSPITRAALESSVRPRAGRESVGISQDAVRRLWTDSGP